MSFWQRGMPFVWWKSLLVGMMLCCICAAASLLLAQDFQLSKYRWQERPNPDRWEGLKAIEISGESIELLGVLLTAVTTPTPQARPTRWVFTCPRRSHQCVFSASLLHRSMRPQSTKFSTSNEIKIAPSLI